MTSASGCQEHAHAKRAEVRAEGLDRRVRSRPQQPSRHRQDARPAREQRGREQTAARDCEQKHNQRAGRVMGVGAAGVAVERGGERG